MEDKRDNIQLGEYPYTYARVSAMKAKLLKKSDYDKMLKMRENEIARYLQDSEYKSQINKIGATLTGTPLVEKAIRENLTDTLNKMKNISDGGLKILITEYLEKEDFFNIKTIIRGKFTKTPNDEIRKLLVPVGSLSLLELNKMLAVDDIDKILVMAKLLNFSEIKTALKTFKEKKQLEILEAAIDKVFYKKLVAFIETIPTDAKLIRDFLAGEVDATNIKVVLKFKKEKIGEEILRNLLVISKVSKISLKKWERIIMAKTLELAMKEFEKTPYEQIIKKGAEELQKKNTLSEIDLEFQKYLLKRARTKTHQNPLSVDVILSYMFAKEIEIRNIHTIIKSKQLMLSESFIQKELII